MGISKNDITVMLWLNRHGHLSQGDAVLEIGRQQIHNDIIDDIASLDVLAECFGVEPFSKQFEWKISERKFIPCGRQHLPEDAPFGKELYEYLGLKYACVDLDDAPQSIKMDLNFDEVPDFHKGRYALVTNLGTTEHVADQINAFKIIHDFAAPNGVMFHYLPFHGFSAHGFISYSTQFFQVLCRNNHYKVIDVDIKFFGKYKVPSNVLKFIEENSRIFDPRNKLDLRDQELHDLGINIVLQKKRHVDFEPPVMASYGVLHGGRC